MPPLKSVLGQRLKDLLHSAGFDVRRTRFGLPHKRSLMMRSCGINLVLDVGANEGQYASELRQEGYTGRIWSFEPVSSAFQELSRNASDDSAWQAFHYAIGERNGSARINVSRLSYCSSLLSMEEVHVRNAPGSEYVSVEDVALRRLDDCPGAAVSPSDRALLKIDTQGYEHQVLAGCSALLPNVALLECELSMISLYQGQYLFPEMLKLLASMGFQPVFLGPGFFDEQTGFALQVESIFARDIPI